MLLVSAFPLLLLVFPRVWAQIPLPNPPYTPPKPAVGANGTNNTSPNAQWSTLIGNLLYFYNEQRSGKLDPSDRVPWRNDSALEDGSDFSIDLSGGYYDAAGFHGAGGYVKYTFPLSFTLMSICWSALDFGHGYDLAGQTPYLDRMLRWGLDWLIKANPDPNILYVQVGDADLDKRYWGGDRNLTTPGPRPAFYINANNPGTDAAAQASAAFGACSALYNNRAFSKSSSSALKNSDYAEKLFSHARSLYDLAVHAKGGFNKYNSQVAVPESNEFYPSSGFTDELAIASLFMALCEPTEAAAVGYYADAAKFYEEIKDQLEGSGMAFNWDTKTPGVVVLGAQLASVYPNLIGDSNTDIGVWRGATEKYFDALTNRDKGDHHYTHDGLLWFRSSDRSRINDALNTAMLMMRYALSGLPNQEKQNRYKTFAQQQLDYVLGKNSMHVPYVVGIHPNSPKNPHAAISTGYDPVYVPPKNGDDTNFIPRNKVFTNPDDLDNIPPNGAYVLYGAVVGGPDKHDKFWDRRSDWVQNGVALDYNAPLLALAAQALVSGSPDPFYTSVKAGTYDEVRPGGSPCDAAMHCHNIPAWAIGVICGVVFLAIAVVLVCVVGRRNRRYNRSFFARPQFSGPSGYLYR